MARILIVDDDKEILFLIKKGLLEHNVVFASNAFDALDLLDTYSFDLIILDIELPRMSGYQLTTAIRRKARHRNTPVIFISGRQSPSDISRSVRLGAEDYILKPFSVKELRARVERRLKLIKEISQPSIAFTADDGMRSCGKVKTSAQVRMVSVSETGVQIESNRILGEEMELIEFSSFFFEKYGVANIKLIVTRCKMDSNGMYLYDTVFQSPNLQLIGFIRAEVLNSEVGSIEANIETESRS